MERTQHTQFHSFKWNDHFGAIDATNTDTNRLGARHYSQSVGSAQNLIRQETVQEQAQTNVQHIQGRIKSQVQFVLNTKRNENRENSNGGSEHK